MANAFAEMANGVREIANAFAKMANGFAEIANAFAEIANAFAEIANGFTEMANAFAETANGFTKIAFAFAEIANGFAKIVRGCLKRINAAAFAPQSPILGGFRAVQSPLSWGILMPPVDVQDYANQVIAELGDRYHTRTSTAPPHITLQPPFVLPEEKIAELEQSLNQFAQQQAIVPVTLDGFGAFAPRGLYINVLKPPELMDLQAKLMTHLETTMAIVDPVTKRRGFSSHLTVASRNLTRQSFQQAWSELQPRSVRFEFVGDRVTLLVHRGQRWDVRSEFACRESTTF